MIHGHVNPYNTEDYLTGKNSDAFQGEIETVIRKRTSDIIY